MRCLVTGAAGFIGSNLCERLISEGHQVVGVDRYSDYYDAGLKRMNAKALSTNFGMEILELDLSREYSENLLTDIEIVFHIAAQAGVRSSWGSQFNDYLRDNVLATQKLLEAAKNSDLHKFVFSSTSAVYGNALDMPTTESTVLNPVSPYGITKLAAEQLCDLYRIEFDVPIVQLRYFTVYGPKQRPDMAFARFINAIATGSKITIFGDGKQTRDFTFVDDAVGATIGAGMIGQIGEVFNVGGGSPADIREIVVILEELIGQAAVVQYAEHQPGDALHTSADISKARDLLGYAPSVTLRDGLSEQVKWYEQSLVSP